MFQLFISLFGLSVVALYAGTMRSYVVLLHPEPLEAWSSRTAAEAATLFATLALGVCSYIRTVLTPPGFVNDPDVQAWLRQHDTEGVQARTQCKHCGDRPLRAYHCRHTGRCILRLDHFCVFSNCAIGAGNHKYFLLWQFYQLISSAHMVRLNFEAVTAAVRSREDNTISSKELNEMIMMLIPAIMCLLGAVFTFAAPAAFFPAHVYRAIHNISGVEHAKDLRSCPTSELDSKHDDSSWPTGSETSLDTEEPRSTTTAAEMYDCGGRIRNLDNVLGARRYFWLLPLGAPGLACVLSPAEQRKLAQS